MDTFQTKKKKKKRNRLYEFIEVSGRRARGEEPEKRVLVSLETNDR